MSERDFWNLASAKRVALVGPAAYLENSNKGEFIDSHDLVVRVNRGIIREERLARDLGRRTDILYSCMAAHTDEGPIDIALWEAVKLKAVVIKNTFAHKPYKNRFERDNRSIPYRFISDEFTNQLHEEIGSTNLHVGVVAIHDLLRFGVTELYITGFTFFQGPGCYLKEYKDWSDELAREKAMSIRHDYEKELAHFARVYLKEDRIQADETLRDIVRVQLRTL